MLTNNAAIDAVNETGFFYAEYVAGELEKIGMRSSYRHVMRPLMENEYLTQLELVNITGLKAPTISITLRNMEREGIVRREKNDNDRRETHVFITEKGKEMNAKMLEALDRAEKLMLVGISEKEKETLIKILGKMKNNLCSERGGEKA